MPFGETSAPTPNADLTTDLEHEPFPSDNYGTTNLERPAYWRFKSDTTQWVQLDTILSTPSSYAMDTVIVVWWWNFNTNTYDLIAQDDDSGSNAKSKVSFKAGAGATYFIQVWAWTGGTDGNYVLRTGPGVAPAPSYTLAAEGPHPADSFASAPDVMPGHYCTFNASTYTVEAGEPTTLVSTTPDTKSAWVKFTPPTSGLIRLSANLGHLALFTGSSLDTLELIQTRWNNGNSGLYGGIWALVEAGTQYHLRWAPASATNLSYVEIDVYNVIPATEIVLPFTHTRQRPFGTSYNTGSGALVGGETALQDNLDSTYIDVYRVDLIGGGQRPYVVTIPTLTVDPAQLLDVQLRFRAAVDTAPSWGNQGASFDFANGSSLFYSPFDWRWKATEQRPRILSLRNGSGGLMVTTTMLSTGDWAGGDTTKPELEAGVTGFAPMSYARITEGAILVYLYDPSGVPTQPPDPQMTIAGQADGTRVRFL